MPYVSMLDEYNDLKSITSIFVPSFFHSILSLFFIIYNLLYIHSYSYFSSFLYSYSYSLQSFITTVSHPYSLTDTPLPLDDAVLSAVDLFAVIELSGTQFKVTLVSMKMVMWLYVHVQIKMLNLYLNLTKIIKSCVYAII